ncbi:unnamed protein product [Lactuca saligna]|uniref:Uncharacterized protein n=1 Tax=Lactuca saligna TaxID=75948 RepID=A0AA35Z5W9_LACSI|nr:unnamed protein product [Lactuca saligna]
MLIDAAVLTQQQHPSRGHSLIRVQSISEATKLPRALWILTLYSFTSIESQIRVLGDLSSWKRYAGVQVTEERTMKLLIIRLHKQPSLIVSEGGHVHQSYSLQSFEGEETITFATILIPPVLLSPLNSEHNVWNLESSEEVEEDIGSDCGGDDSVQVDDDDDRFAYF